MRVLELYLSSQEYSADAWGVSMNGDISLGDPLDHQVIEQLLEILSEEDVYNILRSCLADAEQRIATIRNINLSTGLSDFAWNAHDLKSTAGQLGATRLSELAAEIDAYCNGLDDSASPDLDYLQQRRKELLNLFTDVSDSLHNNYLCKAVG